MIYWPAKAPGEVEDFAFDFAAGGVLQGGETISSQTVTATGATVSNVAQAAGKVTFSLAGGASGVPAIITCSITTNAVPARTYVETAILPIGEEPVSLDMAKRQTRTEGTTDSDDYLLDLIQSAREYVAKYCGIAILPTAVAMTFDRFEDLKALTKAPIQSITSIQYYDANGIQQTLAGTVYETVNVASDPLRPAIRLAYNQSWPAARSASDVITVNAVVGYSVVPRPIIRAILMLVSQWYDLRSPVAVDMRGVPAEIPNAVTAMLANFRR